MFGFLKLINTLTILFFLSNYQDGNFTKTGVMSKSDIKIVGQSSFLDFGEKNDAFGRL